MMTEQEAKELAAKILGRSRADSCTVGIDGGDETHLRFARNSATTNGRKSQVNVYIRSNFGKRSGLAKAASCDPAALEAAQARSEEIARLLPENPEFLPPLGPQVYEPSRLFDEASASVPADRLADAAHAVVSEAAPRGLDSSGFVSASSGFSAYATSAGLFSYVRQTGGELTATCRNKTGTWSGWAGASAVSFGDVDAARIAARSAGKASHQAEPLDLDPGSYTVILEPAAVAAMLNFLMWSLDARSADEGRSFFSKKGGGNRLGEQLFGSGVTIFSDPAHPVTPDDPVGYGGLPRRRRVWIEDGAVKTLTCPRFWAERQGYEPVPSPASMVMAGGTVSVDDMIRDTKRGILVTRFWYTNWVDPRTLLVTGLTRDGNFLIENGRIAGPARNLRFNESIAAMLKNIAAFGPAERTGGEDAGITAPALLVKDFNFSSRSGGI